MLIRIGIAAAMASAFWLAAGPAAADTNRWQTALNAGVSLTSGNSTTVVANVSVVAERKTASSETKGSIEWNHGENAGELNIENLKAAAYYKHAIRNSLYWYLDASVTHDDIADLKYRLIVGPGLGYSLLKTERQEFSLETGAAYIREKVGDVTDDIPSVRFAEKYTAQITQTAKVWESAEYLPDISDWSTKYLINAEAGIEAALNTRLALRVLVQDKYNSEPADGRKDNDLSLLAGLSFKL